MSLNNYQITFNGINIGAGTNYVIQKIEGLGGTSPLRIQDDNRGYLDGSYSGRDFYDERTVYIDVLVVGDNSSTAQANYKKLQFAFAPQALGLYVDPTNNTPTANQLKLFQFRLTGDTGDKRMYGRSRGLLTPVDPDFSYGYIVTRIQMTFPDPRYYDDTATTDTGPTVTVANSGWAISCPVISIASLSATSGEITNGTLGSTTDGAIHMYFANMISGHELKVDLLQRVIYYDGVAARNYMTAASNGWLQIDPAIDLTTPSSASWKSNIGSMSVTYRNAYV